MSSNSLDSLTSASYFSVQLAANDLKNQASGSNKLLSFENADSPSDSDKCLRQCFSVSLKSSSYETADYSSGSEKSSLCEDREKTQEKTKHSTRKRLSLEEVEKLKTSLCLQQRRSSTESTDSVSSTEDKWHISHSVIL